MLSCADNYCMRVRAKTAIKLQVYNDKVEYKTIMHDKI